MAATFALTPTEIADLARLVGDVAGGEAASAVPFAAPLLLFSRLDPTRRDALFAPRPGRVLVQEQLAIEAPRRLPVAAPIEVRFRFVEPATDAAAFRIEADLLDTAGDLLAVVRTSIRPIEASSLAAATGLPLPAAADMRAGATTPPLGADLVGRWLRLVGDENPIHSDSAHAVGLGLAGPVVPGALLTATAEALAAAGPSAGLVRLNMRFMAPIGVGTAVATRVRERDGEAKDRRDLRLFFLVGDRAVAVADLGFAVSDR